jgi:putative lipase involved disintegration of autophagic bodies
MKSLSSFIRKKLKCEYSFLCITLLKVHSGFFSYNNTILRLAITSAVHKARESYGDISVIVTGHSMGGAMASFCALDLAVSIPMSKALEMYLVSTIIHNGPSRL